MIPVKIPTPDNWTFPSATTLRPPPDYTEIGPRTAIRVGSRILLYCTVSRARVVPSQPAKKQLAVAGTQDGRALSHLARDLKAGAYPLANPNEGACPAGSMPDGDDVRLVYGWARAYTSQPGSAVNVSAWQMTLANGIEPRSDSLLLAHDSTPAPAPWPGYSGDELVPAGAMQVQDATRIWYITDDKRVGVATLNALGRLVQTELCSGLDAVAVLGGGNPQWIGGDRIVQHWVVAPYGAFKPVNRYVMVTSSTIGDPARLTRITSIAGAYWDRRLMNIATLCDRPTGLWYLWASLAAGPNDEESGPLVVSTASIVCEPSVCVTMRRPGWSGPRPVVFVPSTAEWISRDPDTGAVCTEKWGRGNPSTIPVPGDYDGVGADQLAIYEPGEGLWWIQSNRHINRGGISWHAGKVGVEPVRWTDGVRVEPAVYKSATGELWVQSPRQYKGGQWQPVRFS